jgi:hypothetical protein
MNHQNIDNINQSNLDALWQNVKSYRESKNFKEVLKACVRFRHLAPYNAMLVEIQRPGVRYVLSEKEWRTKFDRGIKPNARPVIVLVPFGPVDFLFEINDTYPLKSRLFSKSAEDIMEEISAPYKTKHDVSDKQLNHFMEQLCLHGIAIDTGFIVGADYGAKIELLTSYPHIINIPYSKDKYVSWDADYLLSVNSKAQNGERFASICHELGHLFCYHLPYPQTWKKWEVRNISKAAEEFEAESVSWLICEMLCIGNPSERYLSGYLDSNNEIPRDVSIERIFSATKDVMKLCSPDKSISYKDGLLYKNCDNFKNAIKQINVNGLS